MNMDMSIVGPNCTDCNNINGTDFFAPCMWLIHYTRLKTAPWATMNMLWNLAGSHAKKRWDRHFSVIRENGETFSTAPFRKYITVIIGIQATLRQKVAPFTDFAPKASKRKCLAEFRRSKQKAATQYFFRVTFFLCGCEQLIFKPKVGFISHRYVHSPATKLGTNEWRRDFVISRCSNKCQCHGHRHIMTRVQPPPR